MRADFAQAAGLATQVEAALAHLPTDLPASVLARLRAQGQANLQLAEAARRGLSAARRRLEDIRRGGTLRTYDGTGRPAELRGPGAIAGRF